MRLNMRSTERVALMSYKRDHWRVKGEGGSKGGGEKTALWHNRPAGTVPLTHKDI